MLFLEPIMLCSSSQFCFHYAHAIIRILCLHYAQKDSTCNQKPPSIIIATLCIIMVQVKIKFPLHFRSTL